MSEQELAPGPLALPICTLEQLLLERISRQFSLALSLLMCILRLTTAVTNGYTKAHLTLFMFVGYMGVWRTGENFISRL